VSEVIKGINWSELGPLTALLVVIMVVLLGLAPLFFRWLYRREDIGAAERKQRAEIEAAERSKRDEREATKDKALLDFVQTINQAIDRIIDKVDLVHGKVQSSETRMVDVVQASGRKIEGEISKLRDELRDQKQASIAADLAAIKERHAPASTRLPHPSTPGA